MNRRFELLILACLLAGCAPRVAVPAASTTPLPAANWSLTLRQPADAELPALSLDLDSNGSVQVEYGRKTNVLGYRLPPARMEPLRQAVEVENYANWPAATADSGLQVQSGSATHGKTPGPEDQALLEKLRSLVPRPFAKDPDLVWIGGRLDDSQPEGHGTDLLLVDEGRTTPAEQRFNLVPAPELGFHPGDLVVVAGHLAANEAGIAQNGRTYTVESVCAWPQLARSTPKK